MSLSPDDVDAIGRLLDDRLAAHGQHIEARLAAQEAAARRRRRFWFWLIVLTTLASLAASALAARKALSWIETMQQQLAAQEQGFIEAKLAYQRQLAKDAQLQRERADAERHANYKPEQPQAEYEAELIAGALKLFNHSMAQQQRLQSADADDPDALMREMEDITALLNQATGMTTRMLLRNTDPARNTPQERAQVGETSSASAAAPRGEADEALRRLDREAAK